MHTFDTDRISSDAQRHSMPSRSSPPISILLQAAAAGRPEVLGRRGLQVLQRLAGNEATTELAERSPVLDVVASGGSPLEPAVRQEMESRLGADFSDVRLHTDAAAHESAKAVSAHAYTVGSNVVFQRDLYDPGSTAGKRMLAHELTHVVQQRGGPVDGTDAGGGVSVSDPSDRFEIEATANAERVVSGGEPLELGNSAAGTGAAPVQRDEAIEEEDQL